MVWISYKNIKGLGGLNILYNNKIGECIVSNNIYNEKKKLCIQFKKILALENVFIAIVYTVERNMHAI
jgi:hypothetical protein